MKSDTVYKLAFNRMLDFVASADAGEAVPSETELSERLAVSRTTVRKVLGELVERGIVRGAGRHRIIARAGDLAQQFPAIETIPASAQVEKHFMEWMLRGDAKPGTMINELELARQFNVGTTGIREFLKGFQRFGLIEKRPNSGWLFKGFTEDFAIELFEIREMFELRSAVAFASLSTDSAVWVELAAIEREHHELLAEINVRFHDFSDLDDRFHQLIHSAVPNRFIDDFHDIISFIFHYHYQWNKRDERQRNEVAIEEHLAYIAALVERDRRKIESACRRHLASARKTLLRAFDGLPTTRRDRSAGASWLKPTSTAITRPR